MVASGKHTGRTDIPLTDRGRAAREGDRRVGRRLLRPHPRRRRGAARARRARDTAELAGWPSDRVDDRLVEWDYGDYEGITTEEIRETVPGWTVWTHPCPDGETAEQVGGARRCRARRRARLPTTDVVLVGHGHFSRVLVSRWLAAPATDGVHFAMDAAGWAVLGDERGEPAHRRRSTTVPWRDPSRDRGDDVPGRSSPWCTSWPSTSGRPSSAS